jgi:crotonobetainyl-CoA:carnitine CoA-transferase CaiB-like acyl-CoA transferase
VSTSPDEGVAAPSDGPLAGLRVLELATLNAGPTVGAMLGDLGADVVKVEPRTGEDMRVLGAQPGQAARPSLWTVVGRNKRMVTLAHEHPEGLALLARLTAAADVVVLNQPRAVLERMDCTYEAISARNERAVVVWVTGWGVTGPYAGRSGNGTLAEAFAGHTDLQRQIDGVPRLSPVLLGDHLTALAGVIGTLAACYWRDARGGRGQLVDVALYEAVVGLLAPQIVAWDPGEPAPPGPPRRSGPGIRETFPTADRTWVTVTAYSNAQITRLLQAVGVEVGEGSPDLRALTGEWIAGHDRPTVLDAFHHARVGIAPVNDVASLVADEHASSRGAVVEVEDEEVGTVRVPHPSPRLGATPGRVRWTARPLGADNDRVYREWLGLGAGDLDRLRRDEVI